MGFNSGFKGLKFITIFTTHTGPYYEADETTPQTHIIFPSRFTVIVCFHLRLGLQSVPLTATSFACYC